MAPEDPNSPIRQYLSNPANFCPLDEATEREILAGVRRGDVEAKKALIRGNLHAVVLQARKFVDRGISLVDLIHAGNLGLLASAEIFDPAIGESFAVFSDRMILDGILRAIERHERTK